MIAENVCPIHGTDLAPFGGGCCVCVAEWCARQSDKITARLAEAERPDLPEGPLAAIAAPVSDCPAPGRPEALPGA